MPRLYEFGLYVFIGSLGCMYLLAVWVVCIYWRDTATGYMYLLAC